MLLIRFFLFEHECSGKSATGYKHQRHPPGHIAVIARLRGQWVVRLLGGVGRLNGVLGCRIAAPLSGQCGVSGHSQLVTRVIGIFAIAPAGKGIAVAGGGQL